MASISIGISKVFCLITFSILLRLYFTKLICLVFDKYVKSLLPKSLREKSFKMVSVISSIPSFVIVLPLIIFLVVLNGSSKDGKSFLLIKIKPFLLSSSVIKLFSSLVKDSLLLITRIL